jgi:signal transduction histidine kinase
MTTAALILHDDEPTLALARGLLESAGYAPSCVPSVYRLLLEDGPVSPRLVVLAVSAVDERDMEIVPVLRARWPEATFLVTYPAALRERASRALSLGADAYLPEPFYPGELIAIARRAAAGRVAAKPLDAPPRTAQPGGVEQLAAGVAHSIRNPLQILELQLGTAEGDGGLVDVPAMREQLRRISGVLDGLAKFAGRRDIALRPVDVTRLVSHVFSERVARASSPAFEVHAPAEPCVVQGSEELLRAGLKSLRDRAARVTPADGTVHVATSKRAEGARGIVEVAVTDGGPALTESARARLFDPYPDAATVQDGTGLELAALAGIVRDHGGTVAALAAETGGTTIVVRLPAEGGAAPGKAAPR